MKQRQDKSIPNVALWHHLITVAVVASGAEDAGRMLTATLDSLLQQTYRNIEVLVLGGPLDDPRYVEAFAGYRGLFLEPSLSHLDILSDSSKEQLWRGSYLMFAQAGAEFDTDAFALLNEALGRTSESQPDLVLSDYDRISESGAFEDPTFTPGWDVDLIQSLDYIETAFLASRSLIRRQRVRASTLSSLHEWLRIVARDEPNLRAEHVTEAIVHIPLSEIPRNPPLALTVAPLSETTDLAVIIPNRNRPDLLTQCLTFLEFPHQFRIELIIVDNASDDPAVLAIYRQLRERHGAKIVTMSHKFNFARMVNMGVAAATSEILLLLNNDVRIAMPSLVEQMIAHVLRPEVGVVGTKLLNGDGTVQHGGMHLQQDHSCVRTMLALHVLRGASRDDPGYLGALSCVRNCQAVTGALMACRREVFVEVGGFDEVHLPVEFNDVDYCLKVREAGYRVLCLPLDGIFHLESSTRGSELSPEVLHMRQSAIACMAARWGDQFRHDPYRNPWVELGNVPEARFPWSENRREAQ